MKEFERQMTLEELQQDTQKSAPDGWRVTVKLLPDGHTQIRTVKAP